MNRRVYKRKIQRARTIRWQNGNRYDGTILDNQPDCYGTMVYATGGTYTGIGTITYPNGVTRTAEFIEGVVKGSALTGAPGKRYQLREPYASLDVFHPPIAFNSPVPFNLGYDKLTQE